MPRTTIPINWYLAVAEAFHWASMVHFVLWFTGVRTRHRRTEAVLRRLVKSGRLRAVRYGKKLIYSVPRRLRGKKSDDFWGLTKLVHGLACTEGLVRFYRARTNGEIIPEREFYGLGSVPEWGIRYPKGTMILFEFSTSTDFRYTGRMTGKLKAYERNIENIEKKFDAKAIVVFVIDVPRETVRRFVGSGDGMPAPSPTANTSAPHDGDRFPLLPFFFTDYKTFLSVPIGQQLIAPIYFFIDGKVYPLTHDGDNKSA